MVEQDGENLTFGGASDQLDRHRGLERHHPRDRRCRHRASTTARPDPPAPRSTIDSALPPPLRCSIIASMGRRTCAAPSSRPGSAAFEPAGTAAVGSTPPRCTPRPGRGTPAVAAGSSIRTSWQTQLGRCVQVARQRAVVEADEHALLDLLHGVAPRPGRPRPASTARADPAPGRRSSRCPGSGAAGGSAGTGTCRRDAAPVHLGECRVHILDVFEHQTGDRRVDRTPSATRERRRRSLQVHRPASTFARRRRTWVVARRRRRRRSMSLELRRHPGHLSLTTADVEQSTPLRAGARR